MAYDGGSKTKSLACRGQCLAQMLLLHIMVQTKDFKLLVSVLGLIQKALRWWHVPVAKYLELLMWHNSIFNQ